MHGDGLKLNLFVPFEWMYVKVSTYIFIVEWEIQLEIVSTGYISKIQTGSNIILIIILIKLNLYYRREAYFT